MIVIPFDTNLRFRRTKRVQVLDAAEAAALRLVCDSKIVRGCGKFLARFEGLYTVANRHTGQSVTVDASLYSTDYRASLKRHRLEA